MSVLVPHLGLRDDRGRFSDCITRDPRGISRFRITRLSLCWLGGLLNRLQGQLSQWHGRVDQTRKSVPHGEDVITESESWYRSSVDKVNYGDKIVEIVLLASSTRSIGLKHWDILSRQQVIEKVDRHADRMVTWYYFRHPTRSKLSTTINDVIRLTNWCESNDWTTGWQGTHDRRSLKHILIGCWAIHVKLHTSREPFQSHRLWHIILVDASVGIENRTLRNCTCQ